jgi:diketogulonate reductase-like aldo/keto reductase
LYHEGTARSIGVSNYRIADLEKLLTHANVIPAMNQIELHPFLPSTTLLEYMARQSITPVAYSPLGSQNQCIISGEKLLDNKVINDIAKEKGVDVAQVLISWGIGKGWGVLPKSSDRERIARNFQLVDLTALEKQRLDRVADEWGEERRFVNPLDIFGFDFFEADEKAALT